MHIPHSKLPVFDLAHQRVFLRADLNVPFLEGAILNDHKLIALLPTIDLIKKRGGKIILATHIGRPHGYEAALSTEQLIPWFAKRGYTIRFERDLTKAIALSHQNSDEILLVDNLRFFSGEQTDDKAFAQLLFQLGDYYVNDAFALLHRNDTSITLLPKLFPAQKKTFGLLVEQEFMALAKLKENPPRPFVIACGGGKVHDKLPLLQSMLYTTQAILLCPAIVFTFMRAQGQNVGKSLIDISAIEAVKKMIERAEKQGVRLIFPVDYLVALNTFDGELIVVDANKIPENGVGITIGPKTEQLFAEEIKKAGTVFFNGLPGLWDRPSTMNGARALLSAMAESNALTVIGGGDSVAAAEKYGFADRISYCSTGGGATLAYLAGEKLPGLEAMN